MSAKSEQKKKEFLESSTENGFIVYHPVSSGNWLHFHAFKSP